MITGERTGYFTFFRRLSSGALTNAGRIKSDGIDILANANSWPFVCDYNEDGKKDLVVGQEGLSSPCNVYVYLNVGTNSAPVFSDSTPILFNGSPLTYWRTVPVLKDLDNDSKKDMILGGWYSDIRFYKNMGTNANPVFTTYLYLVNPDSSTYSNGNPPRLNFTDWDGDGDLDMITCDYYGSVFLRRNITPTQIDENNAEVIARKALIVLPSPVTQNAIFMVRAANSGVVKIKIYSGDGSLIAIPVDQYVPAGDHRFTWTLGDMDQNRLPNGMYFAALETGTGLLTQKIMIVR
ncbi:hypothetical protein A2Y85_07955 [candidate division WOR-3 bacterium RBG_13_43_14]|uniref:FlgD Ig-like domain-containing protein n=1 Tax=candidate division WOR-3 bacterium RBG_13_43_14 TaxID=1802590 RepID=A0A1F4U8S2_UNCW3|nr:MAG: hypothetical protein A2Y85_07955 [candidate division WOR-3 bacterium RBG_13_43_14]